MRRLPNALAPPSRRRFAFALLFAIAAAAPLAAQRGIPPHAFTAADLGKLRWIEGYWRGTALTGGGQTPPVFERYHFANDSSIQITYYADSAFARPTGDGRVYLSVGRVYQTSGSALWGAAHVGSDGAYFIPEQHAMDTDVWSYQSPNAWKAEQRTSATGAERVTSYQMVRVQR